MHSRSVFQTNSLMSKGQKGKKKQKKVDSKGNVPDQVEDEKPFDFGGLPQRDLKKNLGCG